MIKMSQIKILVEKVCQKASPNDVKQGIIGQEETSLVKQAVADALHIRQEEMTKFQIVRRSLDARKKQNMMFIYQVTFSVPKEGQVLKRYKKKSISLVKEKQETISFGNATSIGNAKPSHPPVVVGMGPAGLFAALTLARAGIPPILLERGTDVETREQKVSNFWDNQILDEDSNVQFGEGGAGTFSDGKLNTLVKDPDGKGRKVLETFVEFGAPSEILYHQKPHIGTDRLRGVVKAMRQELIRLGVQVRFETKLERAVWEGDTLREILISCKGKKETLQADTLILATGHSARDTVTRLYNDGILMEAKSFAVGVRVQHAQEMIGKNQYGDLYTKLPAADYKLTHTTQSGRGVYSFCMCPGGYVVNSSSEQGHLVVNGMSDYARDSDNANSAIVVTVSPQDFGGETPLTGIAFQRKWEKAAFEEADGKIPLQLLGDFWDQKTSTGFGAITPCIKGAYAFGNVRRLLPEFVGDAIADGMKAFDHRIPGFGGEDTILAGIESRTSSPVRICRNELLQSNIKGIYPCGEGAGYAGGITSAAMDGIRVAQAVLKQYEMVEVAKRRKNS